MIKPAFEILNQRGTPMFFSDVFANRPNAGIVGRIFISTDTFAFYRDNGVTWDLIGGPGTGTITGSGTAFKYPVFTNTQEIGDGTIEQLTTKNQSTKDFEIKTSTDDGIYESKLFLTNRFGGNDDTITFQYGKTILAGSPFLKISDNNATYPTSNLFYQGGQFAVNDALLVVSNTLQNNVADFFAVEPVVTIQATGVSNGAKLTFAASSGTYAGIIKLGNTGNILQIRTFADVVALQVNDNANVCVPNSKFGIGTSNPIYDLEIASASSINVVFKSSLSTGNQTLFIDNDSNRGLRINTWGSAATGTLLDGTINRAGASSIRTNFQSTLVFGGLSDSSNYIYFGQSNFTLSLDNTTQSVAIGTGVFTAGIKLDVNGSLRVSPTGTSLTVTGTSNFAILTGNQALIFRSTGSTAGRLYKSFDNSTPLTGTIGDNVNINGTITFSPIGGTATYTGISLTDTINQTGGASGITRGLYVNPTLTAAADYRAIESSVATGTGRWNLYMNGSAANFVNGNTLIGEPRLAGASWTKYLVVGDPSLDKVILGYLASSTNGATIGANNGNLNAWARLNVAGSELIFRIAETERMRLDASGNLGLGVTTLTRKFEISSTETTFSATSTGSDNTCYGLIKTSTSGNLIYGINRNSGNSFGTGFLSNAAAIYIDNNNPLQFGTNNNARVIIFGDGNVGIGTTTNATYKLDVNGTMRVSGAAEFGGNVTILDADNIIVGTTTGTKIGTATSQKLSLWNATPIVQPTTAVGSATFASPGAGSTIKTDDTFDGYTLQQVVKALRDIGILA